MLHTSLRGLSVLSLSQLISTTMGREDSAITATVQAIAMDMTARTMGLMSSATANAANLATVTDNLNGLTESVGGQLSAAASAQASARAEMTAAAATAQAEMTATLAAAANTSEQPVPHLPHTLLLL